MIIDWKSSSGHYMKEISRRGVFALVHWKIPGKMVNQWLPVFIRLYDLPLMWPGTVFAQIPQVACVLLSGYGTITWLLLYCIPSELFRSPQWPPCVWVGSWRRNNRTAHQRGTLGHQWNTLKRKKMYITLFLLSYMTKFRKLHFLVKMLQTGDKLLSDSQDI